MSETAAKGDDVRFLIGSSAINSYKRLAYTPWHALAELVDNSTQSFFNHRAILEDSYKKQGTKFEVSISYDRDQSLRIVDNAMGMSLEELKLALEVAKPPANNKGRSKYGMGMKTSACWLGNKWEIITKKKGETEEVVVTVNVADVANGQTKLPIKVNPGKAKDIHYTIIEITDHNRRFEGRTLSKIKSFLKSIYRIDLADDTMTLKWNGSALKWEGFDSQLLTSTDGSKYKKNFEFDVEDKKVKGWVGILETGGRDKAGFSILYANRVIKGWPDAWRPSTIYGQLQGSNDLVNQRLLGEIHLDGFEVSHTKDDIIWLRDQEELVENLLKDACAEYAEYSKQYRKYKDGSSFGPTEKDIDVAVDELYKELSSPEMLDHVTLEDIPPKALIDESITKIVEAVSPQQPRFKAKVGDIEIKVYLVALSPNDPYVAYECPDDSIQVIINLSHPHFSYLSGSESVQNYFRHCIYDGIAEWKAARRSTQVDSNTIKKIKDGLLRVKFEMDKHPVQAEEEE